MAIGHEWSSVGLFLSAVWNAWGLLLSGAVLAALLLCVETIVLRRKASGLGYVLILATCIVTACFMAWQDQYLLAYDYATKLEASSIEKATLTAKVHELSEVIGQQDSVAKENARAMAAVKAQYQTTKRTVATLNEKQRTTWARARLAALRVEGLRLSQKLITNPSEPLSDEELDLWDYAKERSLHTLFHQEQIREFNSTEKNAMTYAKGYFDDYVSRSGGVLVKEEAQEIQNRLIALVINVEVAALQRFSDNLKTIKLRN